MSILRLAIPSPLRRHFDYLPPVGVTDAAIQALEPGTRLRVPFGRREVTGYLLEVCSSSDVAASALKAALEILDETSLIEPQLLSLCQWATRYYHHPPGEVFSALFPKRLREGKATRAAGEAGWQLSIRGKGLPGDALSRAPRQAEALQLLQDAALSATALKARGINSTTLRTLEDRGLVERCTLSEHLQTPRSLPGLSLTEEQAAAMDGIRAAGDDFCCHLLEGVTGSGKTEIYLQLIADRLAQGKQTLVLVPEIGLTPQTLTRFRQRFEADIAVLHSSLTDAQRYTAWEAARSGSASIVIGTRSAVFTPLARPGLIIVDEEHDGSYKQQDGFRYSARDIAIKRGQIHGCPVILGSATPSLESLHNALTGRYQHHRLTQRAGSSKMPRMTPLDVRRQPLQGGLSGTLIEAIEDTLRNSQQVLLFLNRRGYAPTLQCHDCGWVAECPACDARLTIHRRRRQLRCHHCGSSAALPAQCPQCNSSQLEAQGLGTEQAEDFLRQRFTGHPIRRVDSDSMQGRDAMQELVAEINRGEPCILLGTQMLAKGHHFPAVSLVAIIDADALLFSADFRGEERMAQLLTQVAGRAGRADIPGRVLLQTHYPDHPAVIALTSSSYAEQAATLLDARHSLGLPPAGFLAVMRTDCPDAQFGEQFLRQVKQQVAPQLPQGVALIGPLPSPMQRRAGKYRCQLLLTAGRRRDAQHAAGMLVASAEALPARQGLKWSIDIDPQDVF
jgi:primosomal protein N' (replication factor Y) (superfamily II helicase)